MADRVKDKSSIPRRRSETIEGENYLVYTCERWIEVCDTLHCICKCFGRKKPNDWKWDVKENII